MYLPVLGNPTSRAYTSFSLIPLLSEVGFPRNTSGPSLRRSITPGRKGSIKTSARSTSCRTTAYPLRVCGFGQSCISEGYWGLRGLERTRLGVYSDRSLASREGVWRGGGVGTRTIDTDNLSTEVGQNHAHHRARRESRELGKSTRLSCVLSPAGHLENRRLYLDNLDSRQREIAAGSAHDIPCDTVRTPARNCVLGLSCSARGYELKSLHAVPILTFRTTPTALGL